MTREESYATGFAEGCRWAEHDIRDSGIDHDVREESFGDPAGIERAYCLGAARGYRQTVADFESGRLTWEMFDLAPRSKR